jgi:hypothetical protein
VYINANWQGNLEMRPTAACQFLSIHLHDRQGKPDATMPENIEYSSRMIPDTEIMGSNNN